MSTTGASIVVSPGELGKPGKRLGKGGQAAVFELPDFQLPDVRGPLVYKRYHRSHASSASLREVVAIRTDLDVADRNGLDAIAAWPVRIVEDKGVVVGIVMPRIPAAYLDNLRLLGTGGTKKALREVQNLFIDPARCVRLGRPVLTDEQRLRVCRDFAVALGTFHDRLGVVFGDINAMNEVFRLDAEPMVMFLDCDGVRPANEPASVRQLDAPDWEPPDQGPLSQGTDLYKLGLFVLRCLTPGPDGAARLNPDAAAGALDVAGVELLRRALSPRGDRRPSAREWELYLRASLGEPISPPRLGEVRLDSTFLLSGQPVGVRWEARDAMTVELVVEGRTITVDASAGKGVIRVLLVDTGFIEIRAVNALGVDHRSLGPVAVVRPPRIDFLPVVLPEIAWPDLSRFTSVTVDAMPFPEVGVPFPDPFGLVDAAGSGPGRSLHPVALPALDALRFPMDVATFFESPAEFDSFFSDRRQVNP